MSEKSGNGIVYTEDWNGCERINPKRYGVTIDLDDLYKKIECDDYDFTQSLIAGVKHILDYNIKGIGTVYATTLLFFLSDGVYPIYDRFAMTAIDCCNNGKRPQKVDSNKVIVADINRKKFIEQFQVYMDFLKNVSKNQNYKDYRDLDMALWVYGHGF